MAYESVNLTCNSTAAAECVLSVQIATYLPPGIFQFVVHVKSAQPDEAAEVYYSPVPAVVSRASLLDSDAASNSYVCSLLNGSSTAHPLTQASMLTTLTSALLEGYGAGGLTANAALLNCSNVSGIVGDALLTAMLRAVQSMTQTVSPLAINTVNSLGTSAYDIAAALTANARLTSSGQVWSLLNLTDALTDFLAWEGVGYQSGNDTALDVYNLGFQNIAAVYGALLAANTSDPALHCAVTSSAEQRFSTLLTTAMADHDTTDADVTLSGAQYSASASRIAVGSNSSLAQLSLSIPAAAFSGATSSSYVDVQRIVFDQAQTWWSACFAPRFDASLNSTGAAALIPSPLYIIQLVDTAGAAYSVSDISAPVQFTLPYALQASTASLFTPGCAFYNRSSSSWSTAGCTSVVNSASVSCACTHLTEFTLVSQPLAVTAGNGQAALSAGQAVKHADLLGIFLIYLVPLLLSALLLTLAGVLQRGVASTVPWSKAVYALIVAVSLMRCVCLALLYFDNANSDTALYDQNSLSATTTTLLLLPLALEVVLLSILGYRYAVVRRKEGASTVVNGKVDLRRASVYSGPASLAPRGSEMDHIVPTKGRRQSVMQRLSVMSSSEKPIVAAPDHRVPLAFAAVFSVAAVSALVGYLVLERHTGASSTLSAVSSLLALTFVAALLALLLWLVFLYYSVPNLKAVMRRGQALGWLTVSAFFLQSLLALSFAEQSAGSWYFQQSAGGVHVTLAVYAIVEVGTLCSMALWWRWTLQWWRTSQVRDLVSRYDINEASVVDGLDKSKATWNGTSSLGTPVLTAFKAPAVVDLDSARRDRLEAKQRMLGSKRPSIVDSLIFSVNSSDSERDDDDNGNDSWADPVASAAQLGVPGLDISRVDGQKQVAGEKTSGKEQAYSGEDTIRPSPRRPSVTRQPSVTRPSVTRQRAMSPSATQLAAASAATHVRRPTKVWSNDSSVDSTPLQRSTSSGPQPTPQPTTARLHRSASISASPLVLGQDILLSPTGSTQTQLTSSGVPTPLLLPHSGESARKRQLSISGWALSSVHLAPDHSAPVVAVAPIAPVASVEQPAPAAVPVPIPGPTDPAFFSVAPVTALSMLSAGASSVATSSPSPSSTLPSVDSLAISRPQTAFAPSAQPSLSRQPSSYDGPATDDGSIQLQMSPRPDEQPATNRLRRYVTRASHEDEQKQEALLPAAGPLTRRPRIERDSEAVEPPSPLSLPSPPDDSPSNSRHGHVIHPGRSARVSRRPSVMTADSSAAGSSASSVAQSPAFSATQPVDARPQGRNRAGSVSRAPEGRSMISRKSSVSVAPSDVPRMSPALVAAAEAYSVNQRPSVSAAADERRRGSVVRSDSPQNQRAQRLQPSKVTLRREQSASKSSAAQSPSGTGAQTNPPRSSHWRESSPELDAAGTQSFIPHLNLGAAGASRSSRAQSASASSAGSSNASSRDDSETEEAEGSDSEEARPAVRHSVLGGAGKLLVSADTLLARGRSLSHSQPQPLARQVLTGGRLASTASFSVSSEPHHLEQNFF